MADKARHAFGNSENIQAALDAGTIDAFDILFMDGATEPKVGWIDKDGNYRLVDTSCIITVEGDALPETGKGGKVYIFGDEGYFWNGTEYKPLAKSADLTTLETQVAELETQMSVKVDATTVQNMIEEYSESAIEIVEF